MNYGQTMKGYQDDQVFRDSVYQRVRLEMQRGVIKGIHQLKQETLQNGSSQDKVVLSKIEPSLKTKLTSTEIYEHLKGSVFAIWKFYRKTEKNIEGISLNATAFAIDAKGLLVTNAHVFENVIDAKSPLFEMDSCLFVSDAEGHVFSIDRILLSKDNADLAIFKISSREPIPIKALPIGNDVPVGSSVFLLSHPEGFPYYFSSGIVARKVIYGVYGPDAARMDITADYAIGSSGGPVVGDDGSLVSVVSSTFSIYGHSKPDMQMVVKQTIPVIILRRMLIFPEK